MHCAQLKVANRRLLRRRCKSWKFCHFDLERCWNLTQSLDSVTSQNSISELSAASYAASNVINSLHAVLSLVLTNLAVIGPCDILHPQYCRRNTGKNLAHITIFNVGKNLSGTLKWAAVEDLTTCCIIFWCSHVVQCIQVCGKFLNTWIIQINSYSFINISTTVYFDTWRLVEHPVQTIITHYSVLYL